MHLVLHRESAHPSFGLSTMAQSSPGQEYGQVDNEEARRIIDAASKHDLPNLRLLVGSFAFDGCKAVDIQDESTGDTPLHAAIASCGHPGDDKALTNGLGQLEAAEDLVRFLLENGAIWNQLNKSDLTPGCLAYRLGLMGLYQLMVDAGVRAELLLNRLDEYDELDDQDEDADLGDSTETELQAGAPEITVSTATMDEDPPTSIAIEPGSNDAGQPSLTSRDDVTSTAYLSSTLSMSDSKLLDEQHNGVMMDWEKGIMARSADTILWSSGLRVLNIGFGMGIIDSLIQAHPNKPAEHHIIEAHPDVLKEIESRGWHEKPGVFIHAGRWQDVLPSMVNEGLVFDAIYYDTFAESYKDFKDCFSEHLLGLLESNGKWSYFNGMGADRQISYDVYQKVVEMDLFEAGYDVEWQDVDLPDLGKEWEGVRRKYWNVEKYRLPVCKFMD